MQKCQQWFTFCRRITNDLFLGVYFPEFFPMVISFVIKKKSKSVVFFKYYIHITQHEGLLCNSISFHTAG